jgi:hypothetical protein
MGAPDLIALSTESTVSNVGEDELEYQVWGSLLTCCHWSESQVLPRELVVREGRIMVRYVSAPCYECG